MPRFINAVISGEREVMGLKRNLKKITTGISILPVMSGFYFKKLY